MQSNALRDWFEHFGTFPIKVMVFSNNGPGFNVAHGPLHGIEENPAQAGVFRVQFDSRLMEVDYDFIILGHEVTGITSRGARLVIEKGPNQRIECTAEGAKEPVETETVQPSSTPPATAEPATAPQSQVEAPPTPLLLRFNLEQGERLFYHNRKSMRWINLIIYLAVTLVMLVAAAALLMTLRAGMFGGFFLLLLLGGRIHDLICLYRREITVTGRRILIHASPNLWDHIEIPLADVRGLRRGMGSVVIDRSSGSSKTFWAPKPAEFIAAVQAVQGGRAEEIKTESAFIQPSVPSVPQPGPRKDKAGGRGSLVPLVITALVIAVLAVALWLRNASVLPGQLPATSATLASVKPAQALPTAGQDEANWKPVFSESFDYNIRGWTVGDFEDEWSKSSRSIAGGVYHWDVTAKQGALDASIPEYNPGEDFYVSLDVLRTGGADDSLAGCVFRFTNWENYFYFVVKPEDGRWLLGLRKDGVNRALVEGSAQPLPARQVFNLAVSGRGSTYRVLLNGAMVNETSNASLGGGRAGIAVLLENPSSRAVFDFDNFILQTD